MIALFLLLLEIRVKRGSQAQSLGLMATRKKEGGSWLPPSLMRVAILISGALNENFYPVNPACPALVHHRRTTAGGSVVKPVFAVRF